MRKPFDLFVNLGECKEWLCAQSLPHNSHMPFRVSQGKYREKIGIQANFMIDCILQALISGHSEQIFPMNKNGEKGIRKQAKTDSRLQKGGILLSFICV